MDTNKAKITIKFYLEKKTHIIATFSYDGKRKKIYIKESINPDFWNSDIQRAKETIKNKDYPRLNNKINEVENTIKGLFHNFIKEYNRKPTHQELKNIFLKEYFDEKPQFTTKRKKSLLETFDEYIDIKRTENAHETADQYEFVKRNLINFGNLNKQQVQFENINIDFRNRFIDYLQDNLEYAPSTVHRRVKRLKTILLYALNTNYVDKLNINLANFNTKDISSQKIALSEYELNEIANLDLSNIKRLDEVRDKFLIGCYTGLRFSDFIRLNKNHIVDGKYIQIEQQKVKQPLTLPFLDEVKNIFIKYDYNLPKSISEQKFNLYLKELSRRCDSLHRLQEITAYKGGKPYKTSVPRYTLITTHTARRTFATLYSAKGIDLETLRYATGHTTTKQLKQYVKLNDKQKADLLRREFERVKNEQPQQKQTKIIHINKAE